MTQLIRCETDLTLAKQAALEWLDDLAARSAAAPFLAALSGGRIALRFFDAFAEQSNARDVSMSGIEFFWADERCVPPADPESNFRLAQEHLLAPLRIDRNRIHRVPGELDGPRAAAQGEAELRAIAPLNRNGQPVLDLVFLGMGEDGHVASLFPGEPEEQITATSIYRAVIGPKPPPHRVTLSYTALAAARQVWVLASGPGKEEALRQSLEPSGNTPLARLLRIRERTRIFTDIPLDEEGRRPSRRRLDGAGR